MHEPKGQAVRRFRVTDEYQLEDGSTVKVTASAFGFVVRLGTMPGWAPSKVRREFTRWCVARGIVATACEWNHGVYSPRTGKPIPGTDPAPSAYQVMSADAAALLELTEQPFVGEFFAALNVRVPVVAMGNGEERPRPSCGSMFGRPQTTSATAERLAKDGDQRRAADRKAWGLTTAE